MEQERRLRLAVTRIAPVFVPQALEGVRPVAGQAYAPVPNSDEQKDHGHRPASLEYGPRREHHRRRDAPVRVIYRYVLVDQSHDPYKHCRRHIRQQQRPYLRHQLRRLVESEYADGYGNPVYHSDYRHACGLRIVSFHIASFCANLAIIKN